MKTTTKIKLGLRLLLAALAVGGIATALAFPRVSLGPRELAANWLLEGVHIREPLHFGEHSITLQNDLIKWSGSATPSALGQIGMDVTTGIPKAYINSVATDLVYKGQYNPSRPALDANHTIAYQFSGSSPWANLGNGGTLAFTTTGTVNTGVVTPWGSDGINIPEGSNYISSPTTSIGESTTMTIELIARWHDFLDTNGRLLTKYYRADDSWNSPFVGISMESIVGVGGASPGFNFASGGALKSNSVSTPTWGRYAWHYYVMTHDGTTAKFYIDGLLIGTGGNTGALDWGTHGRWVTGSRGQNAAGSDRAGDIDIFEIRVSNIARSAVDIKAFTKTWLGMP